MRTCWSQDSRQFALGPAVSLPIRITRASLRPGHQSLIRRVAVARRYRQTTLSGIPQPASDAVHRQMQGLQDILIVGAVPQAVQELDLDE